MFGKKDKQSNQYVQRALASRNVQRTRHVFSPKVPHKQRDAKRENCWCECTLEGGEGFRSEGIVIDVSARGLRLRFRGHHYLPRIVLIRVPRLGIHKKARVVWQEKGDAGLIFLNEKDQPVNTI